MQRYIAFLRAINVGGHNVKMDQLRTLFSALGFGGVATFIASGNVVFEADGDAAELEARIERHLHESLGYEVATFLRTPAQLAEIIAYPPFAPDADRPAITTLSIGFTRAAPGDEARARLMAIDSEFDDFHAHGREVYWGCRVPLSETRITNARLEKAIGMPVTFRNATTARKLAAKYPA